MNIPSPSIGVGSLTTIAAIIGAVGVFISDWASSGDPSTGLGALVAALVAIFFGGRSYQAGKITESVTPVQPNVEIDGLPVNAHEGATLSGS